jgi:glycosyltransferase involved in cell wall biosynthesis
MKIAYVFPEDAANPSFQSGRSAALLQEFLRQGHEVDRIFPLMEIPSAAASVPDSDQHSFDKHRRRDRNTGSLAAIGAQFSARMAGRNFDFVFCPCSDFVAQIKTDLPVIFSADATFANLVDYHWDFTDLSTEELEQGYAGENAALAKAELAVFPSEWAARAAIEQHHADPARVAVIPFGATLGRDNQRSNVLSWITRRPIEPLRLLFVGRHWERQGGDTVIATALSLIAHGHPVEVDIVGCDVPADHRSVPWVRDHGYLHEGNPVDSTKLRRLYAEAHFVFVPSRAEIHGSVFTEASAFGTPPIATKTGYTPVAIRHGHNGLLLPPDATPSDYADAIATACAERTNYMEMCYRAFDLFEQQLNWSVFTRKFFELVQARAALQRPAAVAK